MTGYSKYTYEYVRQFIHDRDGYLLSEYNNTSSSIKIRCGICKHEWETSFKVIKSGRWCKPCSLVAQTRYNENYVRAFLENNKIMLLSKYSKINRPIRMKCEVCSYEWTSQFRAIKSGSGCYKCAMKRKKQKYLDHLDKVIGIKDGKRVSSYINSQTKIKILCLKCNVEWATTPNAITYKKTWCPSCGFKKQKELFGIIKKIYEKYNVEYNYKGFDWLVGKANRKMEIDIFVFNEDKSFSLAIEYDGEQHYRPVCFGGMSMKQAKINFLETKKRDRLKTQKIIKNKQDIKFFIRFNYMEELSYNSVIQKLRENNIRVDK